MPATAAHGDTTDLASLRDSLRDIVGSGNVTDEAGARVKASADWAKMSPVLAPRLPAGVADLVVFPRSSRQIPDIVAAAVERRVPITPRGKGTGNYGQAIPLHGGLVIDFTRANGIVSIGDGSMVAEAGAKMNDLEAAARQTGQELWMYPSTGGSSIGGFLSGGSGGTGSIRFGRNSDGFVEALDVVTATSPPEMKHVTGSDTLQYLHTYGVTGIIATATVKLAPATDWMALYASFTDFAGGAGTMRSLGHRSDPWPRLVSFDEPPLVAALPADEALVHGTHSLRAIVDPGDLDGCVAVIESAGGTITGVRHGTDAVSTVSSLSYNHPTYHLQQRESGWFHLEVGGDALIDSHEEIRHRLPGVLFHMEGNTPAPNGMLMWRFRDIDGVYETIDTLESIGVGVHDCHNWFVDRRVDLVRATAPRTDPHGLLNPGKLPPPSASR